MLHVPPRAAAFRKWVSSSRRLGARCFSTSHKPPVPGAVWRDAEKLWYDQHGRPILPSPPSPSRGEKATATPTATEKPFGHVTIKVVGVGGGGVNTVNNMIERGFEGVEFVVANTDAQQLTSSKAPKRLQLGQRSSRGFGAGAKPERGKAAAEESIEMIRDELNDTDMLFVTAGMGGGTGTGAAPVIARAAKEKGILTVGIVTKPFHSEGSLRMVRAEAGIRELVDAVDTLIVINNQNLLASDAFSRKPLLEAFQLVNNVLFDGIKSVTYPIVRPGLVNIDFADVDTIMRGAGRGVMGTGEAQGEDRSRVAATQAINNPLLETTSIKGAKNILISVAGGQDLTLHETEQVGALMHANAAPDANIIWGTILDESLKGKIRVSIIATGLEVPKHLREPKQPQQAASQHAAPGSGPRPHETVWQRLKQWF